MSSLSWRTPHRADPPGWLTPPSLADPTPLADPPLGLYADQAYLLLSVARGADEARPAGAAQQRRLPLLHAQLPLALHHLPAAGGAGPAQGTNRTVKMELAHIIFLLYVGWMWSRRHRPVAGGAELAEATSTLPITLQGFGHFFFSKQISPPNFSKQSGHGSVTSTLISVLVII